MKAQLLFAFSLVGIVLSGPAKRDCGQEKCYSAVNECGTEFGGCWTECANGVTEVPTFTAPPCTPSIDSAVSSDVGYPTQTSDAGQDYPSSTDSGTVQASITTPPSLDETSIPSLSASVSSSCSPLWLCVDYLAVCGDLTQMYGGCFDTCTTVPPIESPPCSLSSTTTESGYATSVPTPEPGVAYTEEPAADEISSAVDDSKALVMAEMPAPSDSAPAPETSATASDPGADAGALRVAETKDVVQAPSLGGSMRGNAILQVMADKERTPNTPNVPCWDKPTCKEVQLGIPNPNASAAPEESAAPTEATA